MKKQSALLAFALTLLTAQGQPLVSFANVLPDGAKAPIYTFDPWFPFAQWGDAGRHAGALLSGSGYTAELWGGPLGSVEEDLTPVGTTTFRTGESAGYLQTVQLPMPSPMVGERATFQVRVWENLGGAVSNWSQALSGNFAAYGSSAVFSPPDVLGNEPLNLVGLSSFDLIAPKSLTNFAPDCVSADRSTIAWFNGPLSETSLDLDLDGTPDVAFWAERGQCTADYPISSCYTPFYVGPLGGNGILFQTNELWIRPPGFLVGATGASNVTWSTSAQTLTLYWFSPRYGLGGWTTPLGKWGAGYLGVRFHAQDGIHYGWVHVQLASGAPTITDWAYETRPGVAISTGAKPVVIPLAPSGIVRPGYLRLRWLSEVDVAYQVQAKVQLDEPVWTNLEFTILATSTNSIVDIPMAGAHRFFRIVEAE